MNDYTPSNAGYKALKPSTVRNNEIGTSDMGRVLPRQLSTGSTRGTQTVGYGNTKIDGSNDRITIGNPADGTTIGMGAIPGSNTGEFGFFTLDSEGRILMKFVNGTFFFYNQTDDYNNSIRIGSAPDDGRTGIWTAKSGEDVTELLGG